MRRGLLGLMAIAAGVFALSDSPARTLSWPDLLNRPRPAPDTVVRYGADPLQHVDLWLPKGRSTSSVVLMVHGGCWQSSIADATIMNYVADALRQHGVAVWNIEYRGVDRPGGGYPGTFLDVAAAADALKAAAPRFHLDISHLVAFGHSAGGHLALWLAARTRIDVANPLHARKPLAIATVISAGGLPDLEAAQTPPGDTCGADAVHGLTGQPSAARPNVYADTSPVALAPFLGRQVLVNGSADSIAPPSGADAYTAKMQAKGTTVQRIVIPGEGHVELIAPGSAAWAAKLKTIVAALRAPKP